LGVFPSNYEKFNLYIIEVEVAMVGIEASKALVGQSEAIKLVVVVVAVVTAEVGTQIQVSLSDFHQQSTL
jgi:hypothetical protein